MTPEEISKMAIELVNMFYPYEPTGTLEVARYNDRVNRVKQSLLTFQKQTREEDASIAEITSFDRICDRHEGEIRTTYHGCSEIAKAIMENGAK